MSFEIQDDDKPVPVLDEDFPDISEQIHRIDVGIAEAMEVTDEYTRADTNIKGADKKYNQKVVDRFIKLFEKNINGESFEHYLVMGPDVGCGLFSFGDFGKDPATGLFLAYREYLPSNLVAVGGKKEDSYEIVEEYVKSMFSLPKWVSEFYIGAYNTPPNYISVFTKGAPDQLMLEKDHFIHNYNTGCSTGATIKALCVELNL